MVNVVVAIVVAAAAHAHLILRPVGVAPLSRPTVVKTYHSVRLYGREGVPSGTGAAR